MNKKSGQAIAEFVVGILAILIVLSAILQLNTLTREDTRTMLEARAAAGAAALSDDYFAPVSPGPSYLQDWQTGPDGNAYTRDDQPVRGNASLLSGGVITHMHPDELDARVPGNPLSPLADSSQVLSGLGFVRGHASSAPIPLLPVTRNLVFGRDSITLESQVFLVWTRGLE